MISSKTSYLNYCRFNRVITNFTENSILIIEPIAANTSLIGGYAI